MSDGAPLIAPLRRIRRRLRFWRALEGAVMGGAAGLMATALATAALHFRGVATGPIRPLLLAVASVAGGALLRGFRPLSLLQCARFADAALDGQDRILSALCVDRDRSSPLERALRADAIARLATVAPERAVPPRRPRALPALLVGALAVAIAALAPVRSRAAFSALPPSAPTPLLGRPLVGGALTNEKQAARAEADAARTLGDAPLVALANALEQTLVRLEVGTLSDGEALDALKAIEAGARDGAQAAERARLALGAAERALTSEAATRAAGRALGSGDEGAAERARTALGTEGEAHPSETGRALAAAARGMMGVGNAGPEPAADKPGRRRLTRDDEGAAGGPATDLAPTAGGDDERHLERLRRDLDKTAGDCLRGDPSCRAEAESRARDLSGLAARSAAAEPLRRLERTAHHLKERVARGDLRQDGESPAARRFQRAARGEGEGEGSNDGQQESAGRSRGENTQRAAGAEGSPGGRDTESPEGSSGGRGLEGPSGSPSAGGRAMATDPDGPVGPGSASAGDGIGHGPGGEPLGKPRGMESRGRDTEAQVADGAGPNRAEVIGVAASRGFTSPGYARVFGDYEAAVEDALGATAVPEGKRYVVRRYFDLIRPRPGGLRK